MSDLEHQCGVCGASYAGAKAATGCCPFLTVLAIGADRDLPTLGSK